MAIHNRIASPRRNSVTRRSFIKLISLGLVAASLSACTTAKGHTDTEGQANRQELLVTLDVAENQDGSIDAENFANVRQKLLSKMKYVMAPQYFESIRTYSSLPIIALSADRELIFYLLKQPEVRSLSIDLPLSN